MPIRHGGIAATRASIWPRDHFCLRTIAPRWSSPTTWNEFLPISMPMVAMVAIDLLDMAVLRLTLAPSQHHSPVGQEHGRTIPLADLGEALTSLRMSPGTPARAAVRSPSYASASLACEAELRSRSAENIASKITIWARREEATSESLHSDHEPNSAT